MIRVELSVNNPFSDRWENLWSRSALIAQHKAVELEVLQDTNIINLEFMASFCTDHAGITLMIGLLGYTVHFSLRDTRHWDYDNRCWRVYD